MVPVGAGALALLLAGGVTFGLAHKDDSAVAASNGRSSGAQPAGFQETFERDQGAVVRLDVDTCEDSGTGTGFFIDPRHILTAAHVVDGASHIRPEVGGRPISAGVIGIDRAQDLALLESDDNHDGPVIPLGERPGVGAPVAAIGYPGGEDLTLTTGTVSALDRELDLGWSKQRGVIQTDAAVNPGNSGGPLLGLDGKAVGLVFSKQLDVESTAFAVAADAARADAEGWIKRPQVMPLDKCDGSKATAAAPTRSLAGSAGANYVSVQQAEATCVAPPSQDNSGNVVGYFPDYLIDGDASTAWRCAGSAKGVQIRLSYPYPVRVEAVGMTPGYAKYDPADGEDRYPQNRRVALARWTFDDGSSVTQRLDVDPDNRSFQTMAVPAVTTRSVVLTILGTSAPGTRDYTAISELGVYGS